MKYPKLRKDIDWKEEDGYIVLFPICIYQNSILKKEHPLTEFPCDNCNQLCWLTPNSEELSRINPEMKKYCLTCMDKLGFLDNELEIIEISEKEDE
jgi:hypothetical protein